MSETHSFQIENEPHMRLLAQVIAIKCRPGDVVSLRGDLGAGKTAFARAFIRGVLGRPDAEVPSPTFPVQQSYESERFPIHHFDLYRITDFDELVEIGFEDALDDAVSLVEWPDRAEGLLPENRITITIAEVPDDADARQVELHVSGSAVPRMARVSPIFRLIIETFPHVPRSELAVSYLQGDASARTYARLEGPFGRRVVMDFPQQPDGPPIRDGLPYSRLAHLAENITPFLAIGDTLRRKGFSAPRCEASDASAGVAIFEDLGDTVFTSPAVVGACQAALWRAAVDTLLSFHATRWPDTAIADNGLAHTLPAYDATALEIEVELLPDWYFRWTSGKRLKYAEYAEFLRLWRSAFELQRTHETTWVLRDFHSPNLLWLPDRPHVRNVGLIDFQDALIGHPAYDLVSLLQDARVDVDASLESELLDHYETTAAAHRDSFDATTFRTAYALLGAQRNTKILGIFARLAMRDHKPQYLRHIPRIRAYLARDLAHPALSALKGWYDQNLPPSD
jgi:N-acetylmuramate 1-kinase